MKCPLGLDKVHCQNCYFWRDGKCDHDRVIQEQKANPRHKSHTKQPEIHRK